MLDLILVFDAPRPFTRPRAEDDLHQHNVFFDTGVSDPGVLAHGVAVTDDARSQQLVAVDSSAYANLIMSLPRLAGESASAGAAGGPQKPGLWGFELFLHDDTGSQQRDTHRWSAIVLYGTQFGDLQRVSLVQEHYTDLSPATVNVVRVAAGRIREPRDSLLGDDPSSTLVDPKDPAGRRLSLVRGGDGLLHSVVGETPVVWQGPGGGGAASGSGSSSGGGGGSSALVRLPDSMYLHLPVSLAMVSPSEPFRLEFGGPMREDDGLMRRMVVEYGADGRLSGLHKDTFRTRPVD